MRSEEIIVLVLLLDAKRCLIFVHLGYKSKWIANIQV